MTISKLHLYDRSRVTQDWKCPRLRYWNYHYGGTGIVSEGMQFNLFFGTTIHSAMAAIAQLTKDAQPIDIDLIAVAAQQEVLTALSLGNENDYEAIDYAREQAALAEGLVRGFYKHAWPRLLKTYPNILFIEHEMELDHDGMKFMSKPDLIMGNDEGTTVYVEYKTTSSKKEDWINSWDTAVQLHSTIRAVKATTGIDISSVIVQGLYKGYESYGKQGSPFCYAYKRWGNPPFTKDETQYEYKAGFKRAATWELPGGTKAWVDGMPEDMLADQFPQTPPIFVNDDLVDRFFRQRAKREQQIADTLEFIGLEQNAKHDLVDHEQNVENYLDYSFPQRFDQCKPGWGFACDYRKLCHGCISDPLKAGFTKRQPHHQQELDQQEQA